MDIKNKIIEALSGSFPVDFARLEDDDGITGFVVSPGFQGMSALDRQGLIEEALRNASDRITSAERHRVLMIAGLTPGEYDSVGARIQVHQVKELAGGTIKISLHGGHSDAEYVRGLLNNQKDVTTTAPKPVSGAVGNLRSFRAKGPPATPLTKAKAVRLLADDPYIQVLPNA